MAKAKVEEKELTLEAVEAIARKDFLSWWEGFTKILNKDAKLVNPVANYLQRRVAEIVSFMRDNQKPIRLVVLKPRQMGSSTITSAVITHFVRSTPNVSACLIGDELDTSQNLFNMVNRYIENDSLDWGSTYNPSRGEFSNGSRVVKETANDPGAGRSMTLQALLCSEVAHYRRAGERSGEKILLAIRNCVPAKPDTIVIEESTPNGAGGAFYNTWQNAVEFEDFKKGQTGNGYVRVFAAWHDFEENSEPHEGELELTFREEDLKSRYNLTNGQILWRRRVLKEKCSGDHKQFDQEYPNDPITCFLTSGRPRFDQDGLAHLDQLCKKEPMYGVLDTPSNFTKPIFRKTSPSESWLYVWEQPQNFGRYLIAVDCMTGSSQVSGADPDAHAVFVLKAGHHGETDKWVRHSVVARIRPPCRVDVDVLADLIERLALYYGGCLIVPEVNGPGLALIELLKVANLNIYQREIFNLRESKRSKALGWQTTDKTRRMVVENLASHIRDYNEKEFGIDVFCRHAVAELRSFVVAENGRPEAAVGKHDDDVLAMAIGLATIEGATPYIEPKAIRNLPPDLQKLVDSQQKRQLVGTFS